MTKSILPPYVEEKSEFSLRDTTNPPTHFCDYKSVLIADVPYVPARDKYCMPASLAMVVEYLTGVTYPVTFMANVCRAAVSRGTTISDDRIAARFRERIPGMDICYASGGKEPLEQVERSIARGNPVMIEYDAFFYRGKSAQNPKNCSHVVVAVGYGRDRLLVLDPQEGAMALMKHDGFEEAWGRAGYGRSVVTARNPPRVMRVRDKGNEWCRIYKLK